jgi:hypothetical protein
MYENCLLDEPSWCLRLRSLLMLLSACCSFLSLASGSEIGSDLVVVDGQPPTMITIMSTLAKLWRFEVLCCAMSAAHNSALADLSLPRLLLLAFLLRLIYDDLRSYVLISRALVYNYQVSGGQGRRSN